MKKRLLAVVLALVMVLGMVPAAMAAEGDTSIGTVAELQAFATAVNGGDAFEGETVTLTADLDLTNVTWTPIGNGTRSGSSYSGAAFKGTFDGGNHTIAGLTIADTDAGDKALGLFGVVDGGTVKNLNLTDVNINVSTSELAGGAIGILTGAGIADNIIVSGTISAGRGNGGIVGRMLVSGTISNCVNNATITATGGANVGGIAGAAYYTEVGKTMAISGCTNNGTVTGSAGVVGGIVGLSSANISGCKNTAAVTGASDSVGGIVGEQQNYGSIVDCANSAAVTNNSTAYGTGGIVGWIRYNGATANYPLKGVVEVKNNANRGEIDGGNDAGGIVGTVYHAAEVSGNENIAQSLSAATFAAGIVGNFQYNDTRVQGTNGNEIPEKQLNLSNNVSTTTLENISAASKNLYAYDNSSGTQDGKISENSTEWVAQIGTTKYATLAGALADGAGKTVTLLKDITVTEQIKITDQAVLSNVTLDGGGHTITADLDENSSPLYFGDASTSKWATGVKIKDLTVTTAENTVARFGIFLCGGTSSVLTNVTVTGNYHYYGINLYGTHGATMTNCDVVSLFTNGQDDNPLTLVNTQIDHLYANKSDAVDGAKVFVADNAEGTPSSIGELTFWGESTVMIAPETFDYIQTVPATLVAEINGVRYTTLAAAVAAAQDGDTVTLMSDVTLTSTVRIESGKTVTIDLNGKIIDGTENCNIALMSYGDLTVKDSSEGQTGAIKAGKTSGKSGNTVNICAGTFVLESGKIYSVNNAILVDEQAASITINGGTVIAEPTTTNSAALYISSTAETAVTITDGALSGYNGILLWNNTTINMTGGSVTGSGATGIQGNGAHDNTSISLSGDASVTGGVAGIYHPQGGNLTISENASVTGLTAVIMKGGNLTVSGGTITGTEDPAPGYQYVSGGYATTGDALQIESVGAAYGPVTVEITGGTFTSKAGNAVGSYKANDGVQVTEFISGGTYSSKPDDSLIVEGAKAAENSGGSTWGIVPDTTDSTVATVGNVAFDSLKAAVAAAKDGDTVKLLASYEDWKAIQVGKTITIDLNGFNINRTFGGAALDITDGTVIITGNGKISGATDGILVAYDAELKLEEGVTVEGRDGHGVDNDGKLTVDGAAITATKYGIVLYSKSEENWAASLEMLDGSVSGEYGIAAYANTTVTVKGGTVTGTVAGLAGEGSSHGTTFTVEGGTIQSEEGVGIYHPQNGTLTISGGTIKGATGINIKSGTMNVTGGNIIGTGEDADYSFVGGGFNITGDALAVESCGYPGGAPTVSITGGNFTSQNADAVASYAGNSVTETVTDFISGGSFSSDPSDYCVVGSTGTSIGNGKWGVVEATEEEIADKATVTITVNPTDATVEIKQGGDVIGTAAGTYTLLGGTYTYTVSKPGYDTKTDSFTVAGTAQNIEVTLSETYYAPTYRVTVEKADNGSVKSSATYATQGQRVTITVTPDEGYLLDTLTVMDAKGNEIELTDKGDGKYTFKMPGRKVTVTASFLYDLPYTDVDVEDEFYDAVCFLHQQGLINGMGNNLYQPETSFNRAMIATMLHRLAGLPEYEQASDLTDVADGVWYTDAIHWGTEAGLITGYPDGSFDPGKDISVRELVVFLYRYAQYAEDPDCDKSDWTGATWADAGLAWAEANDLLPAGEDLNAPASRALAAQVIYNVYNLLNK